MAKKSVKKADARSFENGCHNREQKKVLHSLGLLAKGLIIASCDYSCMLDRWYDMPSNPGNRNSK